MRLSPDMPEDMDELLENLLMFNPYMRWSAKECLELPILQKYTAYYENREDMAASSVQ